MVTSILIQAGNRNWHWPRFKDPVHIQVSKHSSFKPSWLQKILYNRNGTTFALHTAPSRKDWLWCSMVTWRWIIPGQIWWRRWATRLYKWQNFYKKGTLSTVLNTEFLQIEDYIPSEWFSPMRDGSGVEGKPRTKRGLMAMKKNNMQVTLIGLRTDHCNDCPCHFSINN